MTKISFLSLLWVVCACSTICAQTTYKRVTLDRGKESEENCIYIINDNDDSVKVIIQYKIGNRYTDWIDYPVLELVPPTIIEPYKIGCIDSTIIGLNLVDVKIVRNLNEFDKKPVFNNNHQEGFFQKFKSWFLKE